MEPNRYTLGRRTLLVAGASAFLAACSSASKVLPASSVTGAPTTGSAPPDTTTTTTGAPPTQPPTTTEPATTTTLPTPTWPLTGLPQEDTLAGLRPAIAVKLDNHLEARPHAGLNQADIVYEEIVEAQITRFFAIFHSTEAAPVGPVRSARTTDVDLLNQLHRPLFCWSGGNAGVVRAIGGADCESRAHGQRPDLYYRDKERHKRTAIEHTLFLDSTEAVWGTIAPGQGVPAPFFAYHASGEQPAGGTEMAAFSLQMRSVPVRWEWDPRLQLWTRSEYGAPHLDITGAPISTDNVVVQFIGYGTSPVDSRSPEGRSVGSGDAAVFTGGQAFLARWERPDAENPAEFTFADGSPVSLTAGRTWIELAEAGVTRVEA